MKKIRKCVIPIAGKGTRFLPITKTISKEMLPIVNFPTILLQVEECYKSGIEEIIFVVGNHNENLVKNFFSENADLNEFLKNSPRVELLNRVNEIINNVKFHYVKQDENIRGTAGAIYTAKEFIEDEYFGVIYGDDLIDADIPVLKQLIDEFDNYHCNLIGVGVVPDEILSRYGVVKYAHDNVVDSFLEKPEKGKEPSKHSLHGRFIINSNIIDEILKYPKHKNNEYYLPEIISNEKEELRAIEYKGNYYDIGNKAGYIKANIAYGLKDNDVKDELITFIKNIGEE